MDLITTALALQIQRGDYVSAEENIIKIIATINNLDNYDDRKSKEKTKGK